MPFAARVFFESFAVDQAGTHPSWLASLVVLQELLIFGHEPSLEEYFLLAIQVVAVPDLACLGSSLLVLVPWVSSFLALMLGA